MGAEKIGNNPDPNFIVEITTRWDGQQTAGTKRKGENTFDLFNIERKAFLIDFDNGLIENDVNGKGRSLGLGRLEAFPSKGDSGGPALIWNADAERYEIAGVVSQVITTRQSPPDINNYIDGRLKPYPDSSFGEINVYTPVRRFEQLFINPIIEDDFHLVLDMKQQLLGNDGLVENFTITARRGANNIELFVDNPQSPQYSGLYFTAPAASILSLTIRGSSDNETIRIAGPLWDKNDPAQLGPIPKKG